MRLAASHLRWIGCVLGLKLKQLRKRARDEGVELDQVDFALDEDDPKSAMVELLLANFMISKTIASREAEEQALRDLERELRQLNVKGLRERAKDEGVDADAVDFALDEDDPKSALVALLLASSGLQRGAEAPSTGACHALLLYQG